MSKKNSPSAGHNKKSFLNKPVEHIDITKFDAREIRLTPQRYLMR